MLQASGWAGMALTQAQMQIAELNERCRRPVLGGVGLRSHHVRSMMPDPDGSSTVLSSWRQPHCLGEASVGAYGPGRATLGKAGVARWAAPTTAFRLYEGASASGWDYRTLARLAKPADGHPRRAHGSRACQSSPGTSRRGNRPSGP